MTPQQLHSIPEFTTLYGNPAFNALLIYLKRNRPHIRQGEPHDLILQAGRMDGWLDCVDTIEQLREAPRAVSETKKPVAYAAPRHPENNQP